MQLEIKPGVLTANTEWLPGVLQVRIYRGQ